MDFFSKNKALTLTVILLVALNIISIGTILYKEFRPVPEPFPRMGEGPGRMPGRVDGFFERELNLSKNQMDRMSEFRIYHFTRMQTLNQKIGNKKKEMMDLAMVEELNQDKIDSVANEIGILYAEISKLNVEHFQQISSILDTSQVSIFKEILGEALPFQRPPRDRKEMMENMRDRRKGMRGRKKGDNR